MVKKIAIAAGVVILVLAGYLFMQGRNGGNAGSYISPSDSAQVAQGKTVYDRHCASCHGLKLEGQPEWRKRKPDGRLPAPPHDESGHTWHHADALLIDIVKHGLVPGRTAPDGYQSDMPAYAGVISDAEINAVLAYIKSAWPPEALEMQKRMTLQQDIR